MKMKIVGILLLAIVLPLGLSSLAQAVPVTDTIQAPTGFFVPLPSQTYDPGYYRWANEDWGWNHNAMAAGFTTATLSISAFDVDAGGGANPQFDEIFVWDNGVQTSLGYLSGGNNIYSYTTFNLGANLFDDIAAGLQVFMDIDKFNSGWAVTLAKSVISVDGAPIPNPNPGGGAGVPEPASLAIWSLIGLGFVGVGWRRRRKNA